MSHIIELIHQLILTNICHSQVICFKHVNHQHFKNKKKKYIIHGTLML